MRLVATLALAALFPAAAWAQDVQVNGLLDLRLLHPSTETSNRDGGFGKTEWSNHPAGIQGALDTAAVRIVAGLTPELRLVGEIRASSQQRRPADILDAYIFYRPVSTTRWRWSVKAGAFFPPVSLENDGIGWSSTWTLTPSAVNSWVGDELRTIGVEAGLEWRGDADRLEAALALFGKNQPAGAGIADHGWTFNSQALGLLDRLRVPDGASGKQYSNEFRQIDGTVGFYSAASWDRADLGRVSAIYYDNLANPAAYNGSDFAWRTRFGNVSLSTELGNFVILAQVMAGTTAITPFPGFTSTTTLYGGYVLAGYEAGPWRAALRIDQFGTAERHPGGGPHIGERGRAITAALTWSPRPHVQLVGEVLVVDSTRPQRLTAGHSSRSIEPVAQLALRLSF